MQLGMEPVRPVMAHELVLEQIRTAIALGRYRPGEKLPRERDLADMLRVSRTTVREALAVLAGEGAIEVRRGRGGGLIVREFVVDDAAAQGNLRTNRRRMQKAFEYRQVIESAGARFAALNRTKADVARLRSLVRSMNLLMEDEDQRSDQSMVAKFQALDHEFHLLIGQAGRNEWIAAATSAARVEMFRPVGAVFKQLETSANHLHAEIVDAVEARDAERAAHLMTDHIEGTRALIDSWLVPPRRVRGP